MNTITIEFSKEDRKRIDDLSGSIAFLSGILGNLLTEETQKKVIAEAHGDHPVTESTAHLEPQAAETTPPADETPAPVAETAPEVKPVSLAEFQKAVTMAVSKGAEAKKAVKAIINKYAESVSAVPEDKRAEVIAELSNI